MEDGWKSSGRGFGASMQVGFKCLRVIGWKNWPVCALGFETLGPELFEP